MYFGEGERIAINGVTKSSNSFLNSELLEEAKKRNIPKYEILSEDDLIDKLKITKSEDDLVRYQNMVIMLVGKQLLYNIDGSRDNYGLAYTKLSPYLSILKYDDGNLLFITNDNIALYNLSSHSITQNTSVSNIHTLFIQYKDHVLMIKEKDYKEDIILSRFPLIKTLEIDTTLRDKSYDIDPLNNKILLYHEWTFMIKEPAEVYDLITGDRIFITEKTTFVYKKGFIVGNHILLDTISRNKFIYNIKTKKRIAINDDGIRWSSYSYFDRYKYILYNIDGQENIMEINKIYINPNNGRSKMLYRYIFPYRQETSAQRTYSFIKRIDKDRFSITFGADYLVVNLKNEKIEEINATQHTNQAPESYVIKIMDRRIIAHIEEVFFNQNMISRDISNIIARFI